MYGNLDYDVIIVSVAIVWNSRSVRKGKPCVLASKANVPTGVSLNFRVFRLRNSLQTPRRNMRLLKRMRTFKVLPNKRGLNKSKRIETVKKVKRGVRIRPSLQDVKTGVDALEAQDVAEGNGNWHPIYNGQQ